MISLSRPDAILLPIRPEVLPKDFTCNPIQNNRFSSRKYFEQLTRRGFEVMPS